MTLDARIGVQLGALDLDVELRAEAGETVAILGPNGAGKTTVLRALSGLVPIDAGRIELDGVVLDDGDATFVPPERRPVGVVFQDYVLFPHLSALDNVAFGLRAHGDGRAAARRTRVRLVGDRRPRRPRRAPGPPRSPAGRRSASRSHVRSRSSRACSCSTSRSPRSTSRRGSRCAATCAPGCRRSTASASSSPTTRSTPRRSPTGW